MKPKPHHLATLAALAALAIMALAFDRDVTASAGGLTLSITTPPEIIGTHTETENGWLVEGPATITATMPGQRLREVIVPPGETRRVVLKDDAGAMEMRVVRP